MITIIQTNDMIEFIEVSPFTSIESAKRVITRDGYKHNLILKDGKVIDKVEL